MHCPVCDDTRIRAVRMDIGYIEEPVIFSSGGFDHEHDPNPRIGTWVCSNDHEYQVKRFLPCISCTLERQAAIKAEQRRINNTVQRRTSTGNDHHHNNPWTNSGHGPVA